MKTCFISRFGAYGDMMHCAHLPQLIKEYYGVDQIDFETNHHGVQILSGNPYVDNLLPVNTDKLDENRMTKNWLDCAERYDMFFNFMDSIERSFCLLENDSDYYRDSEYRRERFGKLSYYDVMTKAAGLPESYYGTRGKLYYEEDEHEKAKAWIESIRTKYGVNWVILINLSGSSLHKNFVLAEEVSRRILDKYKDAFIVLTGDKFCLPKVFTGDRVLSKVDKWNFRTTALMAKYFDLTISMESGLAVVAHSWDAPTLQLLTAASFDNHVKYAKNAYYLQAEAACSPCHKGPFQYFGCPKKDKFPSCVWFDVEKIMEKVSEAYEHSTVLA